MNKIYFLFAIFSCGVHGMPTVVPATGDPYLAGMPLGSTASAGGGTTDTAPTHSPVLVSGLNFMPGDALVFEVTGATEVMPAICPDNCPPPDGNIPFAAQSFNGIAAVTSNLNSLMGVFLDDELPSSSAAPAALDFTSIGYSFEMYAPELKQVFFIGDGLTGNQSGQVQKFIVPDGATRLFLATHDGFGWWNNSGEFLVNSSIAINETVPMTSLFFRLLLGGTFVLIACIYFRTQKTYHT